MSRYMKSFLSSPPIQLPPLSQKNTIVDKNFVSGISISQKASGINTGIALISLITKNIGISPNTTLYLVTVFTTVRALSHVNNSLYIHVS